MSTIEFLAYASQTILGIGACLGALGIALVMLSSRIGRDEDEACR